MNETDQLSLSRYVDGDLSPLERKKVEAMLDADPAARRMVAEYSKMSQFVRELPREPLNQDLVPQLRAALARKRRFSTIPAKSPVLSGLLAASVLIATFTIAYVSLPGNNRPMTSSVSTGTRESTPGSIPTEEPRIQEELTRAIPTPARVPPFAGNSEISETSAKPADTSETVAPTISMALSQSGGTDPAKARGRLTPQKIPPELEERFLKFAKATAETDRKHAIRLHVSSASERQIASILSVIGRFRSPDSDVLERKIAEDGEKPSLSYVALIPTARIKDFQAALRNLPGIEMELELPDDIRTSDEAAAKGSRFIDKDEISRSIESYEISNPGPDAFPVNRSDTHDEVPDAIRLPLPVRSENDKATGTLDEVIVRIRTEPLEVGKEARPTRPK